MRVLLIEDDKMTARLVEKYLESLGHQATVRGDAESGFDAFRARPFPLIVLDIMLPGMDGLDFCRRIRSRPSGEGTYILAATSLDEPEQLRAILSAGANDYIAKPIVSCLFKVRLAVAQQYIDDIGARRNLQNQLLLAEKMGAIGRLAAGIAHEINTPTQFVGDNTRFLQDAFGDMEKVFDVYRELVAAAKQTGARAELVAKAEKLAEVADFGYLSQEIPKAIEQSLEGIERVSKIVRSMKEFSHPGMEEKTLTDLNEAIASTVTVSRNEWKYVAEMQTRFDPDLPPAPCLAGDFNQVILNMIVNAAHAIADVVGDGSDGKGTITIGTRRDGDGVEIRIGDTGTGIPKENLSKIFDPFFTTKEIGKGTGQGLAISHSVIVDKHGGTLRVQSEVGKGTTFIIRLPIESTEAVTMEE